jgi:hypothetical protein|tara:strand:- start:517 stop:720 length:204 start_codon:yes stop_codon:yes gene_type:complete
MNINQADLIRGVISEVHQRINAGVFDEEELYEGLCVLCRMNSETRSDAECETVADRAHSVILSMVNR